MLVIGDAAATVLALAMCSGSVAALVATVQRDRDPWVPEWSWASFEQEFWRYVERAGSPRDRTLHMYLEIPPDQRTAHESVLDEGHVGRFSRGLEQGPPTPSKLHRGRYSEGLERLPESSGKRRIGRFSDGLERRTQELLRQRRGSFAEGARDRPDR